MLVVVSLFLGMISQRIMNKRERARSFAIHLTVSEIKYWTIVALYYFLVSVVH